MPSSSDSSTVTSNASSSAITSSTRSRLSASRSSPKRASGTTLSSGTCRTSTAHALNLSKVALSLTGSSLLVSPSETHAESAVDRDDRAGHVGGVVGGEERDHAGHVAGLPAPAHRHHGQQLLDALFPQAGDHIGLDHPWRDHVHGDRPAAHFAC